MMYWYDRDMGWWGYVGMGIGTVLFWALLIVGIIALVRFVAGDPGAADQDGRLRHGHSVGRLRH